MIDGRIQILMERFGHVQTEFPYGMVEFFMRMDRLFPSMRRANVSKPKERISTKTLDEAAMDEVARYFQEIIMPRPNPKPRRTQHTKRHERLVYYRYK